VTVEKVVGDIEAIVVGRTGLVQQSHLRFIRRTPTFVSVAGDAGADHIVPGVHPTSPPWDNVVQGKLFGLTATILAGVLVAVKHLGPAQFPLMPGTADHIDEADHRRYLKHAASGVKLASVVFQHLCFLSKEQHYSPTRATQIQGLIALIEH